MPAACHIPANTKYLYNICTTSAQRLQRWSNIVQMFNTNVLCSPPGGGGGGTRLRNGRGVPPACSKPDPVPIRLAAKKTPCRNLEINTEFN